MRAFLNANVINHLYIFQQKKDVLSQNLMQAKQRKLKITNQIYENSWKRSCETDVEWYGADMPPFILIPLTLLFALS